MHLKLSSIGQIQEADLHFGDLTVLVGPQATGKSVALQFLKLVLDLGYIQQEMARYGIDWDRKRSAFFNAYFGEGMRAVWHSANSKVWWEGAVVDLRQRIGRKQPSKDESVFFVPAQRVLTMRDGWPRPFTDYSPGDPFAVRDFSEKLRGLMEREFTGSEGLFPQERRLKAEFRKMLQKTIFRNFDLSVDKVYSQKRLVLSRGKSPLPFMVWSAGQREFVPLLLGLYWLMPPTRISRRDKIEWAIIEEMEMGLHPQAINVLLLMVLELIVRGYRVCLSTHSPQVLEMVWALRHLRECNASWRSYAEMFDAPQTQAIQKLIESAKEKLLKVYYFDAETGKARDISDLEPEADEPGGGWGGLTDFSGRANAAVARAVANAT